MKRKVGFLVIFALLGCSCISFQIPRAPGTTSKIETAGNLDDALDDLSKQIVNSMTKLVGKKVAVVDFSDLDGKITDLGKYLAEALITRLFLTEKFGVVERRLLSKILEEQKLSMNDLIDPSSTQEIGKLLGVGALVSGTITDLGGSLGINARIISIETGLVFGVAATKIVKDETVDALMGNKQEKFDSHFNETLECMSAAAKKVDTADHKYYLERALIKVKIALSIYPQNKDALRLRATIEKLIH